MSNALGTAVSPAEKSATVAIPDGVRHLFNQALPDELFLRWRRAGWLGLAYSHLLSMRRWQSFVSPAG